MRDMPPSGCAGHMGWGPTPGVGDCTLSARPSPVEGDNECRLRLPRELWAGAQCRAWPPGFLLGSPVPPTGGCRVGGLSPQAGSPLASPGAGVPAGGLALWRIW